MGTIETIASATPAGPAADAGVYAEVSPPATPKAPIETERSDVAETSPERSGAKRPPERDSRHESTGDVAFAILRSHYDLLCAHLPTVQHRDEAEALHDLRVDIRRLRAALGFFADALPARADAYRERLGGLTTVLGGVRDLDVQSARVAGWIGPATGVERDTLEVVEAALEDRRRRARRRAVAALTSKRTATMFERVEALIARGPSRRSSVARTPILSLAPELLTQEHRGLVVLGDAIGPESSPEALHALRIRCKRLRYATESLKPWYGKPARSYARRLVQVEDILGAHQDAVLAAATLRDIALGAKPVLAPEHLLALGALAERCLEEARGAHQGLYTRYVRVSGRRWRRLVRAMDDAHP